MSAADDLAGARIALQSLHRLLGEAAAPAGHAGPAAADPSRKRESGS